MYRKTGSDGIETETNGTETETNETEIETNETKTTIELSEIELKIISVIHLNPAITQKQLHEQTGLAMGTLKRILPKLQKKGILAREGSRRSGQWKVLH